MPRDERLVEVFCASCGNRMDCREPEANAVRPPCCSEECERDFAEDNPGQWQPDRHYAAGYDYACGYHD